MLAIWNLDWLLHKQESWKVDWLLHKQESWKVELAAIQAGEELAAIRAGGVWVSGIWISGAPTIAVYSRRRLTGLGLVWGSRERTALPSRVWSGGGIAAGY